MATQHPPAAEVLGCLRQPNLRNWQALYDLQRAASAQAAEYDKIERVA